MATMREVENFIAMISPIAQEQAKKHGNKIFPSVCIAQACCESAFGTSPKMKNANALFGIKVGKSSYRFGTAWKGAGYSTKTKEVYNGVHVSIVDLFRAYDTVSDAVEDYFDMLCTSSRYKYALNQPTPLDCIKGIQKAPYATATDYVQTISSIIKKYDLTKYDNVTSDIKTETKPSKNNKSYPTLALNMKDSQLGDKYIESWQRYLATLDLYRNTPTGVFDTATYYAVRRYQELKGLKVDGIIGVKTWATIPSEG